MFRISLTALMLTAAAVAAQTDAPPATKPAGNPTTVPTTLPADASTPKGALRMLFAATDAGDEKAIRALLFTTNAAEERLADATARSAAALYAMNKALVGTLGADEAHKFMPDPAIAARARDQKVPNLVEQISPEGQSATVRLDGLGAFEPLDFKKVGDQWKLRVGKKLQSIAPADLEKQLAMVEIQVKVLNDVAADLNAGKLKTVADIKQAMEAKVRQANMEYVQAQQKAAATRPTTAP
jgi:hypothetical protein